MDGEIRPFRGGLPLSDRGFRYGQHLFESIAIRRGIPLLDSEHLALLAVSAKTYGIPCSRSLTAKLRDFLNQAALADGMLRIYLTAGPGAPASVITDPGCYLTWEPVHFPTMKELTKGISLTLLDKRSFGEGWGLKSGNYASHVEALLASRQAGAQEGIVCDEQGRIISCAMGNLLIWIQDSKLKKRPILCTPSKRSGAREGVVLGWVRRHVPVMERELKASDLRHATALAVTNSRLGIMPVAMLDGRQLSDPSPARALANEYLNDLLGTP